MTMEILVIVSVVVITILAFLLGKTEGSLKDREKLLDEIDEANEIRNDLRNNPSKYERVCEKYKR